MVAHQNKKLGTRTVVFMIMTSCLGIRWIPVAGGLGPAAVLFWLLGTLIFFIPLSLMVMELSLNFRDSGGIAIWVRQGLGRKAGFYVSWFYWINNVFYYPGLLTFIAVNLVYLVGDHTLADNRGFIVAIVLICFWGAVFFNIAGIHLVARITSLSGLFNFRLGLIFVIAGAYYLFNAKNSATSFAPQNFIPHHDIWRNLSDFSILMFALAGVEVIPTICNSLEKPEKNLFRAIVIGGTILVTLYILGTISINLVLTPKELSGTTGLVASMYKIIERLHWSPLVVQFFIISLMFVEFGGLNLWLITSSIIFFQSTDKGILPEWLQRLNKNYVPANALIAQGVLVTIIILLTKLLPSVESIYLILVLMATIIYFLPFIFLSLTFIRLRRRNRLKKIFIPQWLVYPLAIIVITSVVLAIVLSFVPPDELKTVRDIIIYELELIGGPLLFLLIGVVIYTTRNKQIVK